MLMLASVGYLDPGGVFPVDGRNGLNIVTGINYQGFKVTTWIRWAD
jgi:hypothetical protein